MRPQTEVSRTRSLGRHLGRNAVAYLALFLVVAISPLPSWAAKQIGSAQIKNGAVTTKKLANNAVTSKKIKNGQVTKADLAPAARGYTKFVTVRETVADFDNGESTSRSVRCAEGAVAIGGGASVSPPGLLFLGGSAGQVGHSIPVTSFTLISPTGTAPAGDGAAPIGWRTEVTNDTGENDRTASFWAICASK
ncbi:hypothetical protein ACLM5J_08175 [Nocardioides sp. Bht2]|uniref:hypothetical protein n=1 Tax=Nocardioides sp. Bht2 TaxID=3392297 RepID=UPI0039B52548